MSRTTTELLKGVLKATVGVWDPLWILFYRLRHDETKPIPPFKNRDRVGARSIHWFMESGRADYQVFREAIDTYATGELSELIVLDFGAGCGRILQYFAGSGATLWATDVDATAIRYLQRAYPAVRSQANQSTPPLPLADDAVDVAYSFSVWTHLPIADQFVWLQEMKRVVRPGGLLLLSVLGWRGLQLLRASNSPHEAVWRDVSDDALRAAGAMYHEYPIFAEDTELFSGITGSYGLAVHSPAYVRREWSAYFDVLDIREQAFRGHHDLVVLANRPE